MLEHDLESYRKVQKIAKDTMHFLEQVIREGVTEVDIKKAAEDYMMRQGCERFWYHGVGALVFVGDRTTLSVSGRDYEPSGTRVRRQDLVTVDLSPQIGCCWGDYARSILVDEGLARQHLRCCDLSVDMDFLDTLHERLPEIASPRTTLHELHNSVNGVVEGLGYRNLDFNGNFGHSIEKEIGERVYIRAGSTQTLGEIGLFAFEPHLARRSRMEGQAGPWGVKKEDVYYFSQGRLQTL